MDIIKKEGQIKPNHKTRIRLFFVAQSFELGDRRVGAKAYPLNQVVQKTN
jgi:hypothetical protein